MHVVFQYAAKVVDGRSDGSVVAPGEYWTAVNVHNPSHRVVKFRYKVAIALPLKPGRVTDWHSLRLRDDEALEIDRETVLRLADAKFVKGFVVIESSQELDVVAVYTAAPTKGVETIHTERVPARRIEVGLPDLVPTPGDQGSFCKRDDQGNLIVTVCNQGAAPAGPSVTEVDFIGHGTVSVPTPPLAAGACVDLKVPIPPGSFDPDCEFRIRVDANDDVQEENETNNLASGVCLG
jgi:CARDB